MGVHGTQKLLVCGFEPESQRQFGDQFRGLGPQNSPAQQLAVARVKNQFDQPFGFPGRLPLATSRKRKAPDLDVVASFARLAFAQTDTGHLRLAIDAVGHLAWVQGGPVAASYKFDGCNPLLRGHVRQQRRAGHVANRVDALGTGLHPLVNHNRAVAGADAQRFQPQPFDIALDPSGNQHMIYSPRLLCLADPVAQRDPALLPFDLLDPRFGHHFDSLLCQALGQPCGDFLVFARQDLGQGFQEQHLAAKGSIEIGKFHADGPGPDDGEGGGLLGDDHGLAAGDNPLAVEFDARNGFGAGTSGQHHMRGLQLGHDLALGVLDRDLAAGRQPTPSSEYLNLVLLHQIGHAFGQLLSDLAAPANDRIPIHLGLINAQAEFLGAQEKLIHFGLLEQGLGGNAAPIETGAAQLGVFDQRGF